MRLYYEMWADTIQAIKKSRSYMTYKDKIVVVFIGFTIAQGFNLVAILLLLSNIIKLDLFIDLNVFPGSYLDIALAGILSLYLPFALINYYYIFYKKKYLKYNESRKINSNGKAFFIYFICSILFVLFIMLIGKCT